MGVILPKTESKSDLEKNGLERSTQREAPHQRAVILNGVKDLSQR